MAVDKEISIILRAKDEASAVIKKFGSGLTQQIATIAAGFGAFQAGQEVFHLLGQAVEGATNLLKESVREALDAQDAENRLRGAVENAGVSYDKVRGGLGEYLQELQRTTRFSDEEAAEALQRLITFTGSYDQALKALPVTLDLATRLHVNLEAASKVVGVAIEGNTTALAKYGIRLDDETKRQIQFGNESERTAIVLDALSAKVGGSAVRDAQTLSGQYDILQHALGEAREQLGLAVVESGPLHEAFAGLIKGADELATYIRENKDDMRAWVDGALIPAAQVVGSLVLIVTGLAAGVAEMTGDIQVSLGVLTAATVPVLEAFKAMAEGFRTFATSPEAVATASAAVEALSNALDVAVEAEKGFEEGADKSYKSADARARTWIALKAAIDKVVASMEAAKGKSFEPPSGGGAIAAPKVESISFKELQGKAAEDLAAVKDSIAAALSGLVPREALIADVEEIAKFPPMVREALLAGFKDGLLPPTLFLDAQKQVKEGIPFIFGSAADSAGILKEAIDPLTQTIQGAGATTEELARIGELLNGTYGTEADFVRAVADAQNIAAASGQSWAGVLANISDALGLRIQKESELLSLTPDLRDAVLGMSEAHYSFASALAAVDQAQQIASESGQVWTEGMEAMSNAALALGAAHQILQAAASAAINAIVDGYIKGTLSAKSFSKAVAKGISDALKSVATEALVKTAWEIAEGIASAAKKDARGAAFHFGAAAKYAIVSALATAGAALVGRAGAAKGGIVAGSEVGDKQPFDLEAGEVVISRATSSLILGGRAALIDPRSLQKLVAPVARSPFLNAGAFLSSSPAARGGQAATSLPAIAAAPVTLSKSASLHLTVQAAPEMDPEELVDEFVDLVRRRGYRLVASGLVGAR